MATHSDLQLCISNAQLYKSALSYRIFKTDIFLSVPAKFHPRSVLHWRSCQMQKSAWSILVWHPSHWLYYNSKSAYVIKGKFTHLHTISVYLKALPNSKSSQCYRPFTDRAFFSLRNPSSYSLDYYSISMQYKPKDGGPWVLGDPHHVLITDHCRRYTA